jgi:hypothetical protein
MAAGYLGGLIDGEGTVGKAKDPRGRTISGEIRIYNTDPAIIAGCVTALEKLGIEYRLVADKRRPGETKPRWTIHISRVASLWIVLEKVPVHAPIKKARIQELVDRSLLRRRPSKELLVNLLVVRGMSQAAVARELGTNRNSIGNWVKRYGIDRRLEVVG